MMQKRTNKKLSRMRLVQHNEAISDLSQMKILSLRSIIISRERTRNLVYGIW